MDIQQLFARTTTTTTSTSNSNFFDTSAKRAGCGIAITVGIVLIVIMSWICCCKKKGPRPPPTSYKSKTYHSQDLELGDHQTPVQVYGMAQAQELHSPPPPAMLPSYTGGTEAMSGVTANGRVPADEQMNKNDPPPEYPGSPIRRPAELATRQ